MLCTGEIYSSIGACAFAWLLRLQEQGRDRGEAFCEKASMNNGIVCAQASLGGR